MEGLLLQPIDKTARDPSSPSIMTRLSTFTLAFTVPYESSAKPWFELGNALEPERLGQECPILLLGGAAFVT